MANFAQDNFPGAANTDLSGQTDSLGNTWSAYIIGNGLLENGSNAIFEANGANGMVSNSGTPPSADYTVQCNTTAGSVASDSAGVMARVSSAGGGNGYLSLINQNSGAAQLYKLVSGSFTQLGADFSIASATQTAVQCQVTGTTIKLNINGVTEITQTDSAISATGLSGVLCNGGGSTSTLLSSFSAFGSAATVHPYPPVQLGVE